MFEVKPEEFKGELTLNDLFLIIYEHIHIHSGSIIFILHFVSISLQLKYQFVEGDTFLVFDVVFTI